MTANASSIDAVCVCGGGWGGAPLRWCDLIIRGLRGNTKWSEAVIDRQEWRALISQTLKYTGCSNIATTSLPPNGHGEQRRRECGVGEGVLVMARILLSPGAARHMIHTFQLKALDPIATLLGDFIARLFLETAAQVFTVVNTNHMDTL